MGSTASTFTRKDLIQMFQDMDRARKILLSDLAKVMKVMLILPATKMSLARDLSLL